MYELRKVRRSCRINNMARDQGKFLPDEIIIEILSRLPVQSLGRCKCVCKLWCTIIQDPRFIKEHLRRSKSVFEYEDNTNNVNGDEEIFKYVRSKDGVLVEKSNLTGKFRIRNPATKHILDLPDPHGKGTSIWLFYLPKTNNIKLADVYCQEGTENGGCQVLTVGTDLAWRAIDFPSFQNLGGEGESLYSIGIDEVFYVIRFFDNGFGVSEVVCFEIESEHFAHVKIPQALLSSLKYVRPFCWKNNLCLGNLVEQELHIWVLEDYKKQKWAEKKVVIPLTLFGKSPRTLETLRPWVFTSDILWFQRCDGSLVAYNIQTKLERIGSPPPGKSFVYKFIPSLVNLKEIVHKRNLSGIKIKKSRGKSSKKRN